MKKTYESIVWFLIPTLVGLLTISMGHFLMGLPPVLCFNMALIAGILTWIVAVVNEVRDYLELTKKFKNNVKASNNL